MKIVEEQEKKKREEEIKMHVSPLLTLETTNHKRKTAKRAS